MKCIELGKFPFIKQDKDWCIPASIENVLKYHGGEFAQKKIKEAFEEKHNFGEICFEKIKPILEEKYGKNFNYKIRNKRQGDFSNGDEVWEYAKECIEKNDPLIVAMDLPNRTDIHMWTVICMGEMKIRIFDTGPPRPSLIKRLVTKEFFVNHLAPGLGTFLITKK